MARTYHRDSKGRFARKPGGGGRNSGSPLSFISAATLRGSSPKASKASVTKTTKTSPATGVRIQNLSSGGPATISKAEAAAIMFGAAGARKKAAKKKRR